MILVRKHLRIELIPHKPDHIIGLNIDGWIEAEDIQRVVKIIETRLDKGEKLRIYDRGQ